MIFNFSKNFLNVFFFLIFQFFVHNFSQSFSRTCVSTAFVFPLPCRSWSMRQKVISFRIFSFVSNAWKSQPGHKNRTREHLIAAWINSQMLYQLSYDRHVWNQCIKCCCNTVSSRSQALCFNHCRPFGNCFARKNGQQITISPALDCRVGRQIKTIIHSMKRQ